VAEEYDRVRSGYPAELISDVVALASGDGRALEVGAGTGKATVAVAARGLDLTAIEPDRRMADVLARRPADRPNVAIEVCAFEEYVPDRPFGLVFSAQAWHWTDPATRWHRAAAALADGGSLALFWNNDRLDGEEPADVDPTGEWPYPDLVESAEFTDVSMRHYEWSRRASIVDYLANLSTRSAYRIMDPAERDAHFDALADRLGDEVTLRVDTELYLARRA
jgi:SAM-dependent methyltransferase